MKLVMHPSKLDVFVMPNLYGDIVSDLASGLIGGLGFLPSANIGSEYAIFEAVHGSAPDIANPTALLLSAYMMLEYVGEQESAQLIKNAINEVLEEGKVLTPDCGGSATTTKFSDEIIKKIQAVIK